MIWEALAHFLLQACAHFLQDLERVCNDSHGKLWMINITQNARPFQFLVDLQLLMIVLHALAVRIMMTRHVLGGACLRGWDARCCGCCVTSSYAGRVTLLLTRSRRRLVGGACPAQSKGSGSINMQLSENVLTCSAG